MNSQSPTFTSSEEEIRDRRQSVPLCQTPRSSRPGKNSDLTIKERGDKAEMPTDKLKPGECMDVINEREGGV